MLKKQSKMYTVGVIVIVLVIIVIVAVTFSVNGGNKEYDAHLDMAQKYLGELDYEQAIVELRLAINIEQDNSEAYFALAGVYVAMGDYKSALEVLEEGYLATGDTEFLSEQEKIVEEYAEIQKQQAEQEKKEQQENQEQKIQESHMKEFCEKYVELYDFIIDTPVGGGSRGNFGGNKCWLTFEEREQTYGVLAKQLEQYLMDLDEMEELPKGLYSDSYSYSMNHTLYFTKRGAYEYLADIYLWMGKMEECLRVRTEWAEFYNRPDLVQDGNHGYDRHTDEYDRYGRITSIYYEEWGGKDTYIYEESHAGVTHWIGMESERRMEDNYTYDNEGRLIHWHRVITENGNMRTIDEEYTFTGNHSFLTTYTSAQQPGGYTDIHQMGEQFYDEYGREV